MKIKKRYIKEEIERLEKVRDIYYEHDRGERDAFSAQINQVTGRIVALEWVLGFADD